MKNQEEIKSIKEAQRALSVDQSALADRLEALEAETPKREPREGDVYVHVSIDNSFLLFKDQYISLSGDTEAISMKKCLGKSPWETGQYVFKGTFNEVYMLRSDVEKDYVSKEDLRPYSANLPPSMKLAL